MQPSVRTLRALSKLFEDRVFASRFDLDSAEAIQAHFEWATAGSSSEPSPGAAIALKLLPEEKRDAIGFSLAVFGFRL